MRNIAIALACLASAAHGRRVQPTSEQLAAFNPSVPAARVPKGNAAHVSLHPTALDRSNHHGPAAPVMSEITTEDTMMSQSEDLSHLEDSVKVTIKHPNGDSVMVSPQSSGSIEMHDMMGVAAAAAAAAATVALPADAQTAELATAGTLLVQVQQLCSKASFASLMAGTGIYWGRAAGFGGGVEGKEHGPFGQTAMLVSCLSLAILLSARWIESGHFPLSNMYESLLFLGWGVTAMHFYISKTIPKSAIAGALTSPLALLITGGATLLLPAELQKASALVPALKSNWLMMHVSVMMMSYATLLAGSLIAGAFLVLSAPDDGWVGKARISVTEGFASLRGQVGLGEQATATAQEEHATATAPETAAAETMTVATTSATAMVPEATTAETVTFASQPETPNSNPWDQIQSGNVVTIAQPEAEDSTDQSLTATCNDLAYQCSFLGFVFLTLGLISGAVWANEAWGSYWSWDPKETWALIVWFVYVAYLHTRLSPQYTDRFSNSICFAGFAVTWICYVGVNLFGVGLHSYGWLAQK